MSLRDVERAMIVFEYLYKMMDVFGPLMDEWAEGGHRHIENEDDDLVKFCYCSVSRKKWHAWHLNLQLASSQMLRLCSCIDLGCSVHFSLLQDIFRPIFSFVQSIFPSDQVNTSGYVLLGSISEHFHCLTMRTGALDLPSYFCP